METAYVLYNPVEEEYERCDNMLTDGNEDGDILWHSQHSLSRLISDIDRFDSWDVWVNFMVVPLGPDDIPNFIRAVKLVDWGL